MDKNFFTSIASSASKICLLLFTVAMIVGLFAHVVTEDTFKVAALMVLTYYFTNKGDPAQPYGDK